MRDVGVACTELVRRGGGGRGGGCLDAIVDSNRKRLKRPTNDNSINSGLGRTLL